MTKTDQAKERLRQHLTHLNATGYIDPYQIIRDKVYYYKEVMSALKILGITNDSGVKLKNFDVEAFISALHETKNKHVKQITHRKAKSIGQKMSKSRIDMNEIIKQNETQPKVEVSMPRLIDQYTDQELKDELTARGWHGELMKTMQ